MIQASRRIDAIGGRIEAERASLGVTGAGEAGRCPRWSARYEELQVDLEFANTAYTQALAGLAAARGRGAAAVALPRAARAADARRKRALPAPAAARRADGLFLLLGWGVADARLLQHPRQPLSRRPRRPRPGPRMIEFRHVSKYYPHHARRER